MCIYCKLVIFLTWTFFIIDERHVFVIYLINKYEAKYIFYFKCHSKRATMFSQRYQYKHLPLFCYYQTERKFTNCYNQRHIYVFVATLKFCTEYELLLLLYMLIYLCYICALTYLLFCYHECFFLSLICMHAFVVFKCDLFLCCICRLKSHSNLCCICCFNITT